MQHGRIPWPTRNELDRESRPVYDEIADGPRATNSAFALTDDQGRLEGPFNAMLLAPALGSAMQSLGAAIRYRTSLSDREREIAILALAAYRRSEFEWYAHERVGSRVGLTAEELNELARGLAPETLTAAEALVHSVTTKLVHDRDLDDEQFMQARDALGLRGLSELVTLVGYYDHLDLSLNVWRTPLPEGQAPRFDGTDLP